MICTQPRKIAAISLAERVGFEFGAGAANCSNAVGFQVGGQKRVSASNRIVYMTETLLLHHVTRGVKNPFENCCAVIVDEAHTRAISTDVLLGVLKSQIEQWPDLRVVVTSATISTAKFSAYLNQCPVVEIPGRLYPVDVIFRPFNQDATSTVDAVVKLALEICQGRERGDLLCFLTGQNEVESAGQRFSAACRDPLVHSFCLYGKQTSEQQQKVFFPLRADERKVILLTDIAETSVTIDGVRFVIDSCLMKNFVYDAARNISSMMVFVFYFWLFMEDDW